MMADSKPKQSFSIDHILNETNTPPNSIGSNPLHTIPSYGNAHWEHAFEPYTINMHQPSYFPANMPSSYFPHAMYHHQVDQYPPAMQKVHDFWSIYSHPFGGYFLPTYAFKRKGGQIRFTPHQVQHLEQQFTSHKYLSPDDRKKLATRLKLSDRQVKTWFQNRRAKHRRGNIDPNELSPNSQMAMDNSLNELITETTSSSTTIDIVPMHETTFRQHPKSSQ